MISVSQTEKPTAEIPSFPKPSETNAPLVEIDAPVAEKSESEGTERRPRADLRIDG